MKLKLLAMSDTHVGEWTSLLTYGAGRQHLWKTFRDTFGAEFDRDSDGRLQVDELVLIGDIPDRTLSTTWQITQACSALMATLGSALDVAKVVYVPGNHDHTMWTSFQHSLGGDPTRRSWITPPEGQRVLSGGQTLDDGEYWKEYMSVLLGYPDGQPWRRIGDEKRLEFCVANPVYATKPAGGERTYAFAHGTHFRGHWDVTMSPQVRWFLANVLELDRYAVHYDVCPDCDVDKATDMEGLEYQVAAFADSLWPSAGDNPMTREHELWCFWEAISGLWSSSRPAPAETRLIHADELPTFPERVKPLTPGLGKNDESVGLCREHFLDHLADYLPNALDDLVFVYGDTHSGGWGVTDLMDGSGRKVGLYNTGAWIVPNERCHPACQVFVVDGDGAEHVLDVSFQDVMDGSGRLVSRAAAIAEARWDALSHVQRLVLEGLR